MSNLGGCLITLVLYIALGALVAWGIEWYWNIIAPVFHGPSITFSEACAVYVLLSLVAMPFRSSGKSSE